MYAIKENGKWKRTNMSSRFKGVGAFNLLTDEQRAEHGFFKCIVVNENYNAKTQNRSEEPTEWVLEDNIVTATYTITDKSTQTIQSEMIANGETKIESLIQDAVNAINVKYGVKFASIHNMAMYVLVADYPLRTQCESLINWSANLWDTARINQEYVLNGTMTEEEFIALLPIAPVV